MKDPERGRFQSLCIERGTGRGQRMACYEFG